MQFIKPDTNFDFVGIRKIAIAASLILILISIVSLIIKGGPRYGVDFAGGTLIQLKFSGAAHTEDIRKGLQKVGVDVSSIQQFGEAEKKEFLIRTNQPITDEAGFEAGVQKELAAATNQTVEIERFEAVGPQVGKDLREKALFAIFFALLLIAIYISGRFEFKWLVSGLMAATLVGAVYVLMIFQVSMVIVIVAALIITLILFWFLDLKFAMGAIVALIHDVTITVGVFSILDKEFTVQIIAALLTIIGYSLNDTIIVYDRIRENLRKNPKISMMDNINRSINDTLSRTILTSFTVFIVLVALLIFGGAINFDFALAMTVGVVVGTYSSIYIASPILIAWQTKGKK